MINGWIASWRKTAAAAATKEPDSGYFPERFSCAKTVLVKMRQVSEVLLPSI